MLDGDSNADFEFSTPKNEYVAKIQKKSIRENEYGIFNELCREIAGLMVMYENKQVINALKAKEVSIALRLFSTDYQLA